MDDADSVQIFSTILNKFVAISKIFFFYSKTILKQSMTHKPGGWDHPKVYKCLAQSWITAGTVLHT